MLIYPFHPHLRLRRRLLRALTYLALTLYTLAALWLAVDNQAKLFEHPCDALRWIGLVYDALLLAGVWALVKLRG